MEINDSNSNLDMQSLLDKFNNRDCGAFSELYSVLYKELYYFSNSLYRNTNIETEDVIQDAFFNIWDDRKRKFTSLSHLRAFLFVVIRNSYKRHYNHAKIVNKATNTLLEDDDYMIYRAAEAEIFSIVPQALNLLPTECARSLSLLLEGYDIKEVAQMLGKKTSTIYNQRKESLSILRRKMKNDSLYFLLLFMN